jgi:hypothetical protein
MNIDDLKDAWSNDEPKGARLPDSIANLGKTTSAVGRIRKNMKSEFIALLIFYMLLISFLIFIRLQFTGLQTAFYFNTISVLLFMVLILNCFYYSRFYFFYKSISRYDLNLSDSIRKIAYELELNTEIYKTYNFSVTSLAVLVTIALIGGKRAFDYILRVLSSNTFFSSGNMLIVFLLILISFAITYYFINLHVKLQYGKYIKELKQVMDDLGSEG